MRLMKCNELSVKELYLSSIHCLPLIWGWVVVAGGSVGIAAPPGCF